MRRVAVPALAGLLTLILVWTGHTAPPWPTPEITQIEPLDIPQAVAYLMRAELGDTGIILGLTVHCVPHDPAALQVTAFFGAFPGPQHPVQLAVRSPDGTGEGFGPVLRGGPEAGFHSPQLTAPQDAVRFVQRALQPGALISNGYRSFWNRVSAARNQQVRDEFVACVQRSRE